MIKLIAFDADDTLWHNETLYREMQDRFQGLLAQFGSPEEIDAALLQTERHNVPYFGYGIKSFILSMIETAVRMSQGRVGGEDLLQIVDFARQMTRAEVRLLENVRETVAELAARYELVVITKGDLLDQEAKLERSGLADYFRVFETVVDKTPTQYALLFERFGVRPEEFLMVGNSLRSDILPVLALGGQAVYVPYPLTWEHERVDEIEGEKGYHELENIRDLPALLDSIDRAM
jgi:putative hydrolase of the HAD superfamily